MAAPKSTHRLLRRILRERSFDQLTPFRSVAYCRGLSLPDRQLAAQLLTLQGCEQLRCRHTDWMETLSLALQVAPESPEVWEQQGELWLELASRRATADSANRAVQLYCRLVELAPSRFQSWWGYGRALIESCPQRPCTDLLHQAAAALDKARALLPPQQRCAQLRCALAPGAGPHSAGRADPGGQRLGPGSGPVPAGGSLPAPDQLLA